MAYFLRILIIIINITNVVQFPVYASNTNKDYVVLIHGMAQSKRSMSKIATYLESKNYTPVVIDYPSTKHSIEEIVQNFVIKQIENLDRGKKIHIVGYSLGGIIARYVVDNYKIESLGNIILIGSPNRGSEMAQFLENNILIHKIFGPALKDLRPSSDFWSKIKGNVAENHVGVIAGDFSMNPLSSLLVFEGSSDGTVSVESAKVDGMKDFLVLHHSHYFLMRNDEILPYIENFLQYGMFQVKSNEQES
jgi:triacylglycerol lipase